MEHNTSESIILLHTHCDTGNAQTFLVSDGIELSYFTRLLLFASLKTS